MVHGPQSQSVKSQICGLGGTFHVMYAFTLHIFIYLLFLLMLSSSVSRSVPLSISQSVSRSQVGISLNIKAAIKTTHCGPLY